ncbi:vitamin K epoxide reductase complex subunit 1-like protein 1 [Ctenocephalides felis]|uniref:vitamin K epoxide reductase complex subunit 1-like protein 1 n=1 Tax=Ctenocephalides felis TaxID=7515 RepID=UPI000E6E2093|nr:vitamin K epoxide reductase complex subunit 1-like protein 1 [Ctenocephalides felis]
MAADARTYSICLGVTCMFASILSAYALLVELSAELHPDQPAMCDIGEHMSCSRVLTSRYGKGFGIVGLILGENSKFNQPNGFTGIIFYSFISTLALTEKRWTAKIQLALSFISILLSIYLACILYFVLHDLCVVCVTIYFLNLINFILSYKRHSLLAPATHEIKKKRK